MLEEVKESTYVVSPVHFEHDTKQLSRLFFITAGGNNDVPVFFVLGRKGHEILIEKRQCAAPF